MYHNTSKVSIQLLEHKVLDVLLMLLSQILLHLNPSCVEARQGV